ncbi:MAG: hypothetical protein DRR42_26800 [Gammaproteobacteria bacterium]|nr:MAG: hypothetical protein DRR42_26800 [Gammaproteobacteria bacterium]
MSTDIDITYDFRQDTPEGKDPDSYSKVLRQYHKQLWSKALPSGEPFQLSDTIAGHYLHHKSVVGEFSLSSDAVIPTFRWNKQIQAIITKSELEAFNAQGYTIGGMMIFPRNQIDGKWTINQARGCTQSIGDRFDLTLECIRRHYINGKSPLTNVLARYTTFFNLFADFRGYVEFFLLQDLVSDDYSTVHISQPYDNFSGSPIPINITEYRAYKNNALTFISARNQRILSSI